MDNKKLIIWDFDGPIVDSRQLALELSQHQYHDVTEDVHRNLFNGNIFTELSKLKKKDVSHEQHVEFLEKSYWPRKMELAPVPQITKVLEELSQDFVMVVNSSSDAPQIKEYLEKNNLENLFSKIYGNEIRSKEEKFKMILQDFSVSSKDCLLITDTLGDVTEAETLAIPSVVTLWGYQLKHHFDSVNHKVVFVEHPIELTEAVRSHFSKS